MPKMRRQRQHSSGYSIVIFWANNNLICKRRQQKTVYNNNKIHCNNINQKTQKVHEIQRFSSG